MTLLMIFSNEKIKQREIGKKEQTFCVHQKLLKRFNDPSIYTQNIS